MKRILSAFLSLLFSLTALSAATTHREKQCENRDIVVWKTIIEPNQPLVMHRHNCRRLIVALTDVNLLVKNDRGQSHHLIMKQGTARILPPDKRKELHCDIDQSHHPMEVMVIEFKK